MQIRKGKIEDFKKLNQDWAWNPEAQWQMKAQQDYIKGIKAGTQEFWVVEQSEEILGEFHLYWDKAGDPEEADGKKRAYLSAFRIHPDHRGHGLGTKLMERVIERINGRKPDVSSIPEKSVNKSLSLHALHAHSHNIRPVVWKFVSL